jgi:hypothetical protein
VFPDEKAETSKNIFARRSLVHHNLINHVRLMRLLP